MREDFNIKNILVSKLLMRINSTGKMLCSVSKISLPSLMLGTIIAADPFTSAFFIAATKGDLLKKTHLYCLEGLKEITAGFSQVKSADINP